MPRGVAQRIVERSARGEVAVVVPREGRPSRVFELRNYLKMQNLPKTVKPWTHRKGPQTPPDPLGAIEGKVLTEMSRKDIYD